MLLLLGRNWCHRISLEHNSPEHSQIAVVFISLQWFKRQTGSCRAQSQREPRGCAGEGAEQSERTAHGLRAYGRAARSLFQGACDGFAQLLSLRLLCTQPLCPPAVLWGDVSRGRGACVERWPRPLCSLETAGHRTQCMAQLFSCCTTHSVGWGSRGKHMR